MTDKHSGLAKRFHGVKTTCHCTGSCGYMTSNKDGVQIVLFLFMNVACLLCSLSLFIDYSDKNNKLL